jgi:hypothetical protein
MAEAKTKTIGGCQVYVMPLLGETSTLVFYQLQKCLAPALVRVFGALKGVFASAVSDEKGGKVKVDFKKFLASDVDNLDFEELSQVFDAIHDKMTPKDWLEFVKQALSQTTVNGRPVGDTAHFNEVFAGKILLLYKVLWYTLEVNFGDFFAAVGFGDTTGNTTQKPTE